MTDGFEKTPRGGRKAPESAAVTENHGQWLPRQSGRDVNGGFNVGLIHFTDSMFEAAEPLTTRNSINLWSLLKHVQHGFMEKLLRLQYFLFYTCSRTCNVTGFCHCFLSPGTALDKVRASRSVLPWLPGSQLCVVGHIKAFIEDGQK